MNSSTISSSSAVAQFPNLKRVFCSFAVTSHMKMLKAVKKLKFWSRKKRKKKSQEQEPPYYPYPYPYPPRPCHCCQYLSTQPSAPPLPPWLEPEQTSHHHQAIPVPAAAPLVHQPSQIEFQLPPQEEIVSETTLLPSYHHPTAPAAAEESNYSSSYQQYMVPNPVYGVPVAVVQTPRKERTVGFFGCLVDFGIHLIRCFCPCFHIRELH